MLLESRRLIIGSPVGPTDHQEQIHDSLGLFHLSRQGIFEIAAPKYRSGSSLSAIARELGIPKTKVRETLIYGGVALRAHSRRQLKCGSLPLRVSTRTAPYGFCVVGGKLVEDPREAEVVRLIKKWWQQGMSHCAITRRLNDQGIKPRKAALWSQPTVGFIIKRLTEAGK